MSIKFLLQQFIVARQLFEDLRWIRSGSRWARRGVTQQIRKPKNDGLLNKNKIDNNNLNLNLPSFLWASFPAFVTAKINEMSFHSSIIPLFDLFIYIYLFI